MSEKKQTQQFKWNHSLFSFPNKQLQQHLLLPARQSSRVGEHSTLCTQAPNTFSGSQVSLVLMKNGL